MLNSNDFCEENKVIEHEGRLWEDTAVYSVVRENFSRR